MSIVQADAKINAARAKVQEWGAKIAAGTWDWHPLGHALQLTHEAIESEPKYQRPWTMLADLYHRVGKPDLAQKCLSRSYELATPGPNYPGGFYRSIEENLCTGYPFNSRGGVRREQPPEWFTTKYQRYWFIDEKLLSHSRDCSPLAVPTVFLSYCREDGEAVERLRSHLDRLGLAVWMDTKSLLPGEQWEARIQESIQSRDFVVVCLSRQAIAKVGFFHVEVKAALYWQQYRPSGQVFLIPARLDECDIPGELKPYQCADLFGDNWTAGISRIEQTILPPGLRH